MARLGGGILLLASVAKLVSFPFMTEWVQQFLPLDIWLSVAVVASVIFVEAIVGILAIAQPHRCAIVAASLFGAFTILHLSALVAGKGWQCPCFGSATHDIAIVGANAWMMFMCVAVCAANLKLVSFNRRSSVCNA